MYNDWALYYAVVRLKIMESGSQSNITSENSNALFILLSYFDGNGKHAYMSSNYMNKIRSLGNENTSRDVSEHFLKYTAPGLKIVTQWFTCM